MVAVAYGRWSFTRGSNCEALTRKNLVFWIGGRLLEVIAYERWLHMEIRLYTDLKHPPKRNQRTVGQNPEAFSSCYILGTDRRGLIREGKWEVAPPH